MEILVTGADGFIGSYIAKRLSEDYPQFHITAANREKLDLSIRKKVAYHLHNGFDIVVHCAFKRAYSPENSTINDFYENILSFENLSEKMDRIGRLIYFGSGAETQYYEIGNYYALSKRVIAERLKLYNNAYNIRLYGCFGEDEPLHRFMKKSIRCAVRNEPINIYQEKYMGYIYIEDLYKIVNYYIETKFPQNLPAVINANYVSKTLTEIAELIKYYAESSSSIIVENTGYDTNYYGFTDKLYELPIQLVGLDEGIKNVITYIRRHDA